MQWTHDIAKMANFTCMCVSSSDLYYILGSFVGFVYFALFK